MKNVVFQHSCSFLHTPEFAAAPVIQQCDSPQNESLQNILYMV